MSGIGVQMLKMKTYVIKVHIHCQGCNRKVKKLLRKIEGVYTVKIESEQQKVTVTGLMDPAALIKTLAKSGKHAELWSPPVAPVLNHELSQINDDNANYQSQFNRLLAELDTYKSTDNHMRRRSEGPVSWDLESYLNQSMSSIDQPLMNSVSQNMMAIKDMGWDEYMSSVGENGMSPHRFVEMSGGFVGTEGNGMDVAHNFYAGVPAGYGYSYNHPTIATMPLAKGYQYNHHPFPMVNNAGGVNRNMRDIGNTGGYMYQP